MYKIGLSRDNDDLRSRDRSALNIHHLRVVRCSVFLLMISKHSYIEEKLPNIYLFYIYLNLGEESLLKV